MFVASINSLEPDMLRGIWHLNHLNVAKDGLFTWLSNLKEEDINLQIIKILPNIQFYSIKGLQLTPLGRLLPVKELPAKLRFEPIQKYCELKLEGLNHNYFGFPSQLALRLVPSIVEQAVEGLLVPLHSFNIDHIKNAPSFRLDGLQYTIVDHKSIFIVGTPVLGLQGKSFWRLDNHFIPSGFRLNFPELLPALLNRLAVQQHDYIIWYEDQTYDVLPSELMSELSRSSFNKYLKSVLDA